MDLIHAVNGMRRDGGLEIQDRIRLVLPRSMEELEPYLDRLADEVLAVSVAFDDVDEPQLERA